MGPQAEEPAARLDPRRAERRDGEACGDLCHRLGPEALRERAAREPALGGGPAHP